MHSVDRVLFWRIVAGVALALGALALALNRPSGSAAHLTTGSAASLWLGLNFLAVGALAPVAFAIHGAARLLRNRRLRPLAFPAASVAAAIWISAVAALWSDIPNAGRLFSREILLNPGAPLFAVPWCFLGAIAASLLEIRVAAAPGTRRAGIYGAAAGVVSAACFGLSIALQAGLGGMFRVAGTRVHPLWQSPQQPLLFALSAIAGGCALVLFLNEMWRRAGATGMDSEPLGTMARAMALFLALFGVVRIQELAQDDRLTAFGATGEASSLFWLEMGLSLLAVVIVLHPVRRNHAESLFSASLMTLAVLMAHRLNVSVGTAYLPSAAEAVVSASLIAAGGVAFAVLLRFNAHGDGSQAG